MEFWIVLAIVAVIVFWGISVYNKLVSLRNRFRNSYAQIDVQLNRRYDLIPNLVETAKAYMKHERETLEAVIAARNVASNANRNAAAQPDDAEAVQKVMAAEQALTGAMTRFFALAENYPELKAESTMRNVMEELSATENKVAFARQAFNDAVMTYNTEREKVPNNLIANNFGFKEAQLFEVDNAEMRQAVRVQFS
ncbi:LemA family protein [Permianibacter aggregans]|uniref:LemA protein n=1 Tax=Permianibacter aggregans TaxID=1510150 RepID=A0A4R6ULH3_9GAMM|nr:LemA family protein [Permianibacter aggregans]QGX40237.1 LemA family protein [Permianibacter aggregans]TDQ47492.1 LemA protein [Permianibacter aggregans]